MAGLMGVTAFLSMWINNSAATSIMLPVAIAISDELEHHERDFHNQNKANKQAISSGNEAFELTETTMSVERTTKEGTLDTFQSEEPKSEVVIEVKQRFQFPFRKQSRAPVVTPHHKKYEAIKKAYLLATAYSATIGGLSSLVGTAPNVFVKGYIEKTYKDTAFRVNFLNFLLFALPVAIIMLILCWLWLQILYNRKELCRCRKDPETREIETKLKAMLVKQYKELGKPK
ncbi:hypothetical protein I4U23_008478 [Adineta vaga]|nr:hypothetical protein I4U23_008478 [Adineta vaga]